MWGANFYSTHDRRKLEFAPHKFGYQLREGPTLTAAAAPAEVALNWTAVDVSHWTPAPSVTYNLYRTSGTTVEIIAKETASRTYVDTDVTPGATCTYQVAAVVRWRRREP